MEKHAQAVAGYGHVWIWGAGQERDSICLSYRRANQEQMGVLSSRLLLGTARLYCPHEARIKISRRQGCGESVPSSPPPHPGRLTPLTPLEPQSPPKRWLRPGGFDGGSRSS